MAMTRSTVVGVFNERAMAEDAIEALNKAGFNSDEIRYSGRGVAGTREGGFWAGLKSLFTGEDTTTTGSASTDNVLNDLTDFGIPQDQAQYYANEHGNGRSVVAVRAPGREQEAMEILRSNGAYDYGSRSGTMGTTAGTAGTYTQNADPTQSTSTGYTRTTDMDQIADPTRPADYNRRADVDQMATTDRDADTEEGRRLRLREEQLNVDKQRAQSGEVQLHKEVVTEQKNIDVPVTHEEVYVERRPVAEGQVDDTPIGEGETIRVPVSEEQVQVSKNPVVTGEVGIGKRAAEDTQRVSDTVRREEARVDTAGNPRLQSDNPDLVNRDVNAPLSTDDNPDNI